MSNSQQPIRDIYERLGVKKDSSAQIIHTNFLKLVNPLLIKIKANRSDMKLLEQLRELWVAHDILVDPDCRADYDLRSLGIVTSDYVIEEDHPVESITFGADSRQKDSTTSWRIGEVLQAVGILEQAELDIACDMHRAMPEMQFGRFLVKQGFLSEAQLEAILIGQTLIRTGEITLSQLIVTMSEVKKSNRSFKEVLLELGYLKDPSLFKLDDQD